MKIILVNEESNKLLCSQATYGTQIRQWCGLLVHVGGAVNVIKKKIAILFFIKKKAIFNSY